MKNTSLKIGFDAQNHHYLTHLLAKEGIKPDPKYSGSPKYLKAWAMVEAGRLLGEPVSQWEDLLKKEITRLDENLITLAQLEKQRAEEMEQLKNDPGYRALMVLKALLRDAQESKTRI